MILKTINDIAEEKTQFSTSFSKRKNIELWQKLFVIMSIWMAKNAPPFNTDLSYVIFSWQIFTFSDTSFLVIDRGPFHHSDLRCDDPVDVTFFCACAKAKLVIV